MDIDLDEFVNLICDNIINSKNLLISATSAHGIVESQTDNYFSNSLNKFKYNLADGMPLVWLAKIKGAKKIKRCYGPALFLKMLLRTRRLNLNHYFCGSNSRVLDKLNDICKNK